MKLNYVKNILVLALVATFAQSALAGQQTSNAAPAKTVSIETSNINSGLKKAAMKAFNKDPQVKKAIAEAMESVGSPQLDNAEIIILQDNSSSYGDSNDESELQVLVVQHYSLLAEHWSIDASITAKLKVVTKGSRYIVQSVKLLDLGAL